MPDQVINPDDCGCSALLACFEHWENRRGRPAIRRVA